jgi:ATP-dependent Clp protease adapter protein ClpS
LLIGLFVFGSPETRLALTPNGGLAGDIPFLVAHGRPEAALRPDWPKPEDQLGDVSILNDPCSPMEAVVAALEESFELVREDAIAKMLEVHESGSTSLKIPSTANVQETCYRLNREWRSAGLALYCVPSRATPIEHKP